MARCGCSGGSCSCLVISGPGVTVEGVGSAAQPYLLSAVPEVEVFADPIPSATITADQVGSSALFVFDPPSGSNLTVNLPGSSASPILPPDGTRLEFVIGGTIDTVSWQGGVTWFGPGPSGSDQGLYTLRLLPAPFSSWAGSYLPYR